MNRHTQTSPSADRNLLFGLMALQLKFISSEQLESSLNTWLLDRSQLVADVLKEQQALGDEQCSAVSSQVERQLEQYAGDAGQCLAAAAANSGSDSEWLLELFRQCIDAADSPAEPLAACGPAKPTVPQVIGNYQLLEPLGEGGMGTVWLAEQHFPVRRRVALKVIKAGRGGKQFVKRFSAERQALALMDHPHIAKVLDAGTTEDGQPYFAMDLVQGLPLTEYCDRNKVSLNERLELFLPVCAAVQHAHQKGIMHRDLKPSNVLVALVDGKPVPKVIDFGLAKAMQHTRCLTDETLQTHFGQVVGTLQYMSPEQAEASPLDVDTRSDIYSLGVMLYELLTGSTPLDLETIGKGGLVTVLETIRNTEPPRPSKRLGDSSAIVRSHVSSKRRIEPRKLQQQLRGELDWIVMKALEKDRARRYDTASSFASDLQRFLDDEPVSARPPSRPYRLAKYLRRNKGVVAATVAIATLLIAGIVGTSWGMFTALAAKKQSDQSKARVEHVLEILVNSFRRPDPSIDGRAVTVASVLDQAMEEARGLVDDPLEQAALVNALGETFLGLGLYEEAEQAFQQSVMLWGAQLGEDHPETLVSMTNLGIAYAELGRYDDALHLNQKILELNRARQGVDHPNTLTAMDNLASAYHEAGHLAKAVRLHEKVLSLTRAKLGDDHPDTLTTMANLAIDYTNAGQLAQAVQLLEEALGLTRTKLGEDHPDTLTLMNNLAIAYAESGQWGEALPLFERTLELRRARLGAVHPDTLASINALAGIYSAVGRREEAMPLYQEVVALQRTHLAENHPHTLSSMNNLAGAYLDARQLEKAIQLDEEVLGGRRAKLGEDHPDTLLSMNNLAVAYLYAGRFEEAIVLLEQALPLQRAKLGEDHPQTIRLIANLAGAHEALGRLEQALSLYELAFELRCAKLGEDHPDTLSLISDLAGAYASAGRVAEAIRLLEDNLGRSRAKLGEDHPDTLLASNNLADAYASAGRWSDALPLHAQTLELRRATLGAEHPETLTSLNNLASAYVSAARPQEALPLYAKVVELSRTKLGENHRDTLVSSHCMAIAFESAGRLPEALQLYEETHERMRTQIGEDHPETLAVARRWATALIQSGQIDQGAKLLEKNLNRERGRLKNNNFRLAEILIEASRALVKAKHFPKAVTYLHQATELLNVDDGDHWRRAQAQSLLGAALTGQGKYGDAEPLLLQGYEDMKRHQSSTPRPEPRELRSAVKRLVDFYAAVANADQRTKWEAELARVNGQVDAMGDGIAAPELTSGMESERPNGTAN